MMKRIVKSALAAAASAALLASCANVPPGAGENPADPWESMNRQTFAFTGHNIIDRAKMYSYK